MISLFYIILQFQFSDTNRLALEVHLNGSTHTHRLGFEYIYDTQPKFFWEGGAFDVTDIYVTDYTDKRERN